MEEVKLKKSKMPSLKDVINYRDFFGEYPIIFAIKIISSLALIYVITNFTATIIPWILLLQST